MPTHHQIVRVSSKGQIVIPANLRQQYGIDTGTELNIVAVAGGIKLVPARKRSGKGFHEFDWSEPYTGKKIDLDEMSPEGKDYDGSY